MFPRRWHIGQLTLPCFLLSSLYVYFIEVSILFHSTRVPVLPFTPKRKARPSLVRFAWNSQKHSTASCAHNLYRTSPYRSIGVQCTDINSLPPLCTIRLPQRRISRNPKSLNQFLWTSHVTADKRAKLHLRSYVQYGFIFTFTKHTTAQRHYVDTSYAEFHPDLSRNKESANKSSFTSSSKVWPSLSRLSWNWRLCGNFRKEQPYSIWRTPNTMSPGYRQTADSVCT
jgi:hypothetical protein